MDADCLIKIAKGGFKENVLGLYRVTIPDTVRAEVGDHGSGGAPGKIVARNIQSRRIRTVKTQIEDSGDDALLEAFHGGRYAFVATDDKRLIRRFSALGIPCVVPGLLLFQLYRTGRISKTAANAMLDRLKDCISRDESQIVRFLIEER